MGVPEVRLLNIIGSMPWAGAQEVVEISSMDKGLVSRSLGDLIKRNYLRKIQDPQDRRRFTLKLTALGARIYRRIKAAKHSRHLRAVAGMTPDECRQLYALLDKALVTAQAMAEADGAIEHEPADSHEGYSHSWPPAGLLELVPDLAGAGAAPTRGQVSR
jgi:DNA-binding MarR family transcriptional regulator